MNLRRLIILGIILSFATVSVFGQRAKVKRANAYFEALSYNDAIQLYLEVLDKRDVDQAKVNLAESYRKIGNLSEAEYWYGQSVRLPDSKPVNKLYYAMALQSNGKCDLAEKWFAEYHKENPDDARGQLLKESCSKTVLASLSGDKAKPAYKVKNLKELNTELDDFGAAIFENGIVFASERDQGGAIRRVHTWTGNPFLELFFAQVSTTENDGDMDFSYSEATKYNRTLNTRFHDGPVCFSADQSTIYFTRNNILKGRVGKDDAGIIRLKIYSASSAGGDWSNIKSMPFNSDEYSVAHPAVSASGDMMIFSSDMPGGFGGMDLYQSNFENGRWSPAINLNSYIPGINTEGHELFPALHKDGTLYFSSDGHMGLGGLDNLFVKKFDNAWGQVANVGAPINSESDDFAMVVDNKKQYGFFSSNRSGGAGNDDVYGFYRLLLDVEVFVFDKETGDPIEGAVVTQTCKEGLPIETGEDGKILYEFPIQNECSFSAAAEGFLANKVEISTEGYEAGGRIFVQVPLAKPLEFQLAGVVKDDKTGKPLKNAKLVITNDCDDVEQNSKSDKTGAYSFDLEEDCCYKVFVERRGYLDLAKNICTRGETSSMEMTEDLLLAAIPRKSRPSDIPVVTTPSTSTTSTTTTTGPIYTEPTITPTRPITTIPNISIVPGNYSYSSSGIYDYPGNPTGLQYDPSTGTVSVGTSIINTTSTYTPSTSTGTITNTGVITTTTGTGMISSDEITIATYTSDYFNTLPIIYHDFDKANIKEMDRNILSRVLTVMKDNTNVVIEIGAHTDSRGKPEYNNYLSNERAKSVRQYFVSQGIKGNRITFRGYGESQISNECVDGVKCSEAQHSKNRRTEIRVIGVSYGQ